MAEYNQFIKRKVAERNLSLPGFADSIGVSEAVAEGFLVFERPPDLIAKRISVALKFSPEEEAMLLQLLEKEDKNMAMTIPTVERAGISRDAQRMINSLWIAVYFLGTSVIVLGIMLLLVLILLNM
ncbi:MAG: hypothetical protein M1269_05470 [Chloroflexi bacterium]|nr:hypothetical protein [Chloroflexota bacterium]